MQALRSSDHESTERFQFGIINMTTNPPNWFNISLTQLKQCRGMTPEMEVRLRHVGIATMPVDRLKKSGKPGRHGSLCRSRNNWDYERRS
jgi:hypothetical protein